MKILINEKLSEHKYKTPEGYLVCVDSILARTGKQTYRRNELFHDGDETEVEVDRTPEEVFSEATLASFENKPVTVEHPDEDVNVNNYKEYAVGFVRDVKRGFADGQDVILGTLVITDAQTIEEIENGEHTDLSCGYDCDILDEDNPSQKNIRGNHVALCQQGRAGIAKIVDSVNDAMYCVEFSENGQIFKTWVEARDEKEAQVIVLHTSPKARIRNVYRDSIDDTIDTLQDASFKYSTTLGQEDFDELSRINQRYGIGYTVKNDAVYLVGKRHELENFIKKEFARYGSSAVNKELANIVDSVSDVKNKLSSQDRKFIANYLRMISTYTSRDVDIKDLLRPLSGHGFNWTIEKIDGWNWKKGEYAYKDYYVSINGYDDKFLVTLYADPNQDWKVKEVNAYFTDSVNDLRYSPADIKVGRTFEHRRKGKFKVLKQTGLNDVIIEYENGDKFKTSTITLAEDLNGGIIRMTDSVNDSWALDIVKALPKNARLDDIKKACKEYLDELDRKYPNAIHNKEKEYNDLFTDVVYLLNTWKDSVNDSTYKCEFKLNADTMWTYVKADSPEDAKREILDKFANAKNISVTSHDSVEDAVDLVFKDFVFAVEQCLRKAFYKLPPIHEHQWSNSVEIPFDYSQKNWIPSSASIKNFLKNEYGFNVKVSRVTSNWAYEKEIIMTITMISKVSKDSVGDSISDASRGHQIVIYAENYLSKLGKNNSIGKYDRIIHGVKSLLENGFLEGEELKHAVEREVDRLLKQHGLDSAMKIMNIIKLPK